MNVYDLLADAMRRRPNETAVRYGSRTLTYRDLAAAAERFGRGLAEWGCEPGDRVVLFLRNCMEYPVFVLGAMRAGVIIVPVNAKLHPREVAYICSDCEPAAVITHPEYLEPIRQALPATARLKLAALDDLPLDTSASPSANRVPTAPDDPAWIFYTSGTTGRPKGATLTHRNLIAATVNCLADIFSFTQNDRVLHVAPLSHGSGLYMLPSLARGAENIISDRPSFDPDEVLEIVAREKISAVAFVAPTMIVRMLEAKPRDDVGSLRGVIYGGATIHLEHIRAAVARFGAIFVQLYGQGEAPMTISYLPAADHAHADDELLLSAGYVRTGIEVRLVDENGEIVAEGRDGEIAVRGDVVMKGYWRNSAATEAALKDGWLRTGDIGRFDSGGRLRVLDRRHDTIISGGTNIYPKEIEDVLAVHPAVREVIAFGVPDSEWGESVAVAIVLHEESADATAADLLAHCKAHLASFKKPKHLRFLKELPKSAYGKVLRRQLREQFGTDR